MIEYFLGISGGIGGTFSVANLGIKNSCALPMPKANDSFVSMDISFSNMGWGCDRVKRGVNGIVRIVMGPMEYGAFVDDGI